jgi:hypothetical protein
MMKCELEIDTRFERARQLKPGRTMARTLAEALRRRKVARKVQSGVSPYCVAPLGAGARARVACGTWRGR